MKTQRKKVSINNNQKTVFCKRLKRWLAIDEFIQSVQEAQSPAEIDMFEVRQWIPEGKTVEFCCFYGKKVLATSEGYVIEYNYPGMFKPKLVANGDGEVLKNLRKEDIVHETSRDEIVRILRSFKKNS